MGHAADRCLQRDQGVTADSGTLARRRGSNPSIALKMLVAHSTGKKSDITTGYMQFSTEQLRQAAQVVADRFKELCKIDIRELCKIETPTGENVSVLR